MALVRIPLLSCNMVDSFGCTKQFENNKQHTYNCIDYIGKMAGWSKALVLGTSHFDGVSSNPTVVMLHCYKFKKVLTTKKQFENDKQYIFNCY